MQEILSELKKEAILHKEAYNLLEIEEKKLTIFDVIIEIATKIETQISITKIDSSYLQLYNTQISQILGNLPYRGQADANFVIHQNVQWKEQQKDSFLQYIYSTITKITDGFKFQIDFFDKIKKSGKELCIPYLEETVYYIFISFIIIKYI